MSTAVVNEIPNLKLYGGYLSVKSLATGEHRTFRIRQLKDSSKFAPGSRTVGLLVAPDEYRDFAFVGDDGRIILWKKHRDSEFYQWVAKCLSNPERYVDKVEYNFDARCRRCGRQLTDPDSAARGLGPDCAQIEGM